MIKDEDTEHWKVIFSHSENNIRKISKKLRTSQSKKMNPGQLILTDQKISRNMNFQRLRDQKRIEKFIT